MDGVPPQALFGGLDDETWRWLNFEGRELCPFLPATCRRCLPRPSRLA